ncbi:MAG: response regulator [Pseudomonadota bacterium]
MGEKRKYRILTIDDETYIRQSIVAYLEDFDFIVFEAENGKKGIEIFEREKLDLVLLDLRMPEMDGLQVLEIIREKAPDLPFVVASGTGNISSVVKALQLGAWDYILKPIEDMSVLYHAIKKCLKQSQLIKENKQYQEQLEEIVAERTLELQASEERYKAIFEYTGTAAIIIEPDDTISMVNSKFCEFAGMARQDILDHKKWYDFVAIEHVEIMRNYIDHKINSKTDDLPVQYEIRFISNRHQEKYVYSSLGIIPGTDKVVVSLLDVTERRKAEQRWRGLEMQLRKSQKMEAIGTLAGGIAHDLNNILSPILGYADMIMRSSDPSGDEFKRSYKIQQAALRAADLVRQVLSVNRQSSDKKKLIHVHPVSKEVLKLLSGSIPSTIKIVDQIDRSCGVVEADPTQIHQVILNLCTNAYHAMEETGGILTVGLSEQMLNPEDMVEYPNLSDGPGTYIAIEVSDTGCGMSKDVIERIFDPYFTTKEEGKGTGLGLSTVYSIIKSCQGDIKVTSRLGKGTVFTIFLPVKDRHDTQEISEIIAPMSIVASGERLLVVDDDKDIAVMCKDGFENMGYKVDMFSSSLEALEFFKKNHSHIDLVLTDQTMPEKTGIQLAKEMIAIDKTIPIILCSGYSGTITKSKIKDVGIRKFFMKPITIEKLSKEIVQILKNKDCN